MSVINNVMKHTSYMCVCWFLLYKFKYSSNAWIWNTLSPVLWYVNLSFYFVFPPHLLTLLIERHILTQTIATYIQLQ